MQTVHDLEAAFRRALARCTPAPQSLGANVRFPGSCKAAKALGVSRQHLHRVLIGERQSDDLMRRYQAWLKRHPQYATAPTAH